MEINKILLFSFKFHSILRQQHFPTNNFSFSCIQLLFIYHDNVFALFLKVLTIKINFSKTKYNSQISIKMCPT